MISPQASPVSHRITFGLRGAAIARGFTSLVKPQFLQTLGKGINLFMLKLQRNHVLESFGFAERMAEAN